MASEPGGRSDKLGNEFEKLWTVRHLIELLAGRATSVQVECLGDDERGTEFWVGRPDGTREAHQCKRENAAAGRWSVSDLNRNGIIENARFQLGRDQAHHFVFTSGDKVPHLSDLCERARMAENPVAFRDQSVATSVEHQREFRSLCGFLGLDPAQANDLEKVIDYLRRFRMCIADKVALRYDVEDLAARWLTGEPALAIAFLKDLVDNNIGITLRLEDVVAALPTGLRPRDLSQDPTLPTVLQELRDRFDRSYCHLLIGSGVLGRRESNELYASLVDEDGPRLILLHGPGGEGKSGVVFEAVQKLKARGIPYLPLRLDRDRPEDTPLQFGRKLDLPASPTACLAALADGRPAVLLLDQVDAIRWTSAHSAHAWDTCERIISEALNLTNLRVVVVCRSFDVEDHPQIRAWKNRLKATELKVEPLDDATVDAAVIASDLQPTALDSRQRRVLRSPQGLYLWTTLHESNRRPPAFRSLTDLMRLFWEMSREKLAELKPGQYEQVLEVLVEYMDCRGRVDAPRTIIARWPAEVDALISSNILVEGERNNLLFAHQSYLDHLTAERVLKHIHARSGSVLSWLEADFQSLFRRGQLRQVLALLRDDDSEAYAESIHSLLNSDRVRFHLKHLVLQMLGHANPPLDGEVELILSLLGDGSWVEHVFGQVLAGRESWFDALHERGIVRAWLSDADASRVKLALDLLDRVVETRGESVESLILDEREEDWQRRLEAVLWRHDPVKLSPGLFDAYLRLCRCGSQAMRDYIDWKALARSSPKRCLDVLETRLVEEIRMLRAMSTRGARSRRDHLIEISVSQVALAIAQVPIETWDRLTPRLLEVIVLLSRSRCTRHGEFDSARYEAERRLQQLAIYLFAILTESGKALATSAPDALWERAMTISRSRSMILYRLACLCLAAGPDNWADKAIQWLLTDDLKFHCGRGERGAAYRPARRLIRRFSRVCSEETLTRLISAIVTHRPESERRAFERRHELLSRSKSVRNLGFDPLSHNDLGLGQYVLLTAIPRRRLPTRVAARRAELNRKFGTLKPLMARKSLTMGGWVTSTIPRDRLSYLSDRAWLQIVAGQWPKRGNRFRQLVADQLGEATVSNFSADLAEMANLQPQRFARMALQISNNADPLYAIRILRSLSRTEPPDGKSRPANWTPAGVEEIEPVLAHFDHLSDNAEFAKALCWCIQKRGDASWSDETLRKLDRIASTHPDPPIQVPDFRNLGIRDLQTASINCVRGVAAAAIESVLFHRRDRFQIFETAVSALINDPHPAVRVGGMGLALPLWNIDRKAAISQFLTTCSHQDDVLLASHQLNQFLRYSIVDHVNEYESLIDRMLVSPNDDVAKTGAGWVAVVWAHSGAWREKFERCICGPIHVREAVSSAIAAAVAKGCNNNEAATQLGILFNDPAETVRSGAAQFFRCETGFQQPITIALTEAFVASQAVADNIYYLLIGLEGHNGSLRSYAPSLLSVVARFCESLAAESRDLRTARPIHVDLLAKTLLRVYEQSEQDSGLRTKCLDAWDQLLSERVGYDILQHIDA